MVHAPVPPQVMPIVQPASCPINQRARLQTVTASTVAENNLVIAAMVNRSRAFNRGWGFRLCRMMTC
jgi:hypothetical protein